jgi:SAM-dependent methyltransferase
MSREMTPSRPTISDYSRLLKHGGPMRAFDYFCENQVFDLLRGTDTASWAPKVEYQQSTVDVEHGVRYEPAFTNAVREDLRRLARLSDPSKATFYDLGCGKGKILALASETGFKRLVGVEHHPGLCNIARRNLVKLRVAADVVCCSAGDYSDYAGDSVIYLYNPFDEFVLSRTVRRLASVAGRCLVVYHNPVHADLFAHWEFVGRISRARTHETRMFATPNQAAGTNASTAKS